MKKVLCSLLIALWFFTPTNFAEGTPTSNCNIQLDLSLVNCQFKNQTLNGTNFNGKNLSGATFLESDLTGSTFENANLTKTNFEYTNLTDVSFKNANLVQAKISFANIRGVKFEDSNLFGISGVELIGEPDNLPSGWGIQNNRIIGSGQNNNNGIFSYANLDDLNLSFSTFTNAWFTGTTLNRSTLSGSNFSGAHFENTVTSGLKGKAYSLPIGVRLIEGFMIGPGTVLSSNDLKTKDFSKADFSGVLTGNLSGSPKLPGKWKLLNGYILGPRVKLTNADLSNLNLRNLDLSGANLESVNFSGSDLQNSKLSGALSFINVANTKMTGVTGVCGKISSFVGMPASLPNCWASVDGSLVDAVQPEFSFPPTFSRYNPIPISDPLGLTRFTATSGRYSGTPTPTVTYQWFLCSKVSEYFQPKPPTHCKKIPFATNIEIGLVPAFKGKYLAIFQTLNNGFGKSVSTLSETSKKIQ